MGDGAGWGEGMKAGRPLALGRDESVVGGMLEYQVKGRSPICELRELLLRCEECERFAFEAIWKRTRSDRLTLVHRRSCRVASWTM